MYLVYMKMKILCLHDENENIMLANSFCMQATDQELLEVESLDVTISPIPPWLSVCVCVCACVVVAMWCSGNILG